jgi:hypothetical protein
MIRVLLLIPLITMTDLTIRTIINLIIIMIAAPRTTAVSMVAITVASTEAITADSTAAVATAAVITDKRAFELTEANVWKFSSS